MKSRLYRGLIAAFAVTVLTACIRDGRPECDSIYELYIEVARAVPSAQPAEPAGPVDTAVLYIFDGSGRLRETRGVGRGVLDGGEPVTVSYRGSDRPKAVVWGNLKDGVTTTPAAEGAVMEEMSVAMRMGREYAYIPDELYYGAENLTAEGRQYVEIAPAMGRLTLTARGIGRETGERYFFTVETQVRGYDFLRAPVAGQCSLRIEAVRSADKGDLVNLEPIPMFTYPSDHDGAEPLKVSLFREKGGVAYLLARTDKDDKFLDIIPQEGQCVNVMMDFRAGGRLNVDIRITDWDVVEQWEDW